jgi:hypothetical protein
MINGASVDWKSNRALIKATTRGPVPRVTNLFWILFGILIFMPIELGYSGLYLGYFQIIILFFLSYKIAKIKIIVYLGYCSLVLISTMVGNDATLTSLINPIVTGLVLIVNIKDKNQYSMIKNGVYISAATNAIFLIYLLSNSGIGSLYLLLTTRTWAIEAVPYFGNGLAMLFSMAMLIASKEGKLTLVLLFFIGGLLTTSRIPLLTMAIILIFYIIRSINIKNIWVLVGLLSLLAFFAPKFDTILFQELKGRFFQTSDRQEVYSLGLSKIYENPFFGAGSEKLEFFEHTHNSYLQVAYKSGGGALFLWLLLIYFAYFKKLKFSKNIEFILVFSIISLTQIGLQNPNLLIVLAVYYCLFSENDANKFNN